MSDQSKTVILHLGDPIEFNKDLYKQLQESFTVIRPSVEERQRGPWLQALKDHKWGDFQAVFRPFWNSGGEMGRWDSEMIPLLPKSMRLFASAGAGYDWADVDLLAEAGILYCNGAAASSEAVADMAIYHIISVFRNIQWSNTAARSGDAAQFLDAHRHQPVGAHNPAGFTLGIIGLGNIGYRIGLKAYRCFGMKIIYHDLSANGHLWAVGLDVHEDEPNVNKRLLQFRNCSFTAHNAGGAFETMLGFEALSMKNVLAVLGGKDPITPVNQNLLKH
ncbi:Phosphoglycerate dehydrogenase or related dehydrogenase [Geosmithia morbida]|uniref:Phosphoglycerate dehydrogenase or related dehydrogenase n=1 Tax=Geosmithia morbida TaxID=1094350 RepID=A0A9P4YPG1_9HYPO|nr:Phosphoglycerate dehydrogenase or related dehydrogenase [Geosmithia morbida]KAF4119407.1 Phosphoglycerate dehydrogenase or related dehydrogenase [Geosmithia morbida]